MCNTIKLYNFGNWVCLYHKYWNIKNWISFIKKSLNGGFTMIYECVVISEIWEEHWRVNRSFWDYHKARFKPRSFRSPQQTFNFTMHLVSYFQECVLSNQIVILTGIWSFNFFTWNSCKTLQTFPHYSLSILSTI